MSVALVCRRYYNVRFDLPSGHPYSVLLLEDSAFKYTPSYDGVKKKRSLSRLRNHSLNIKCQLKTMIICLNTILTFCHKVKRSDLFLIALIYILVIV